MGAMRGLNSAGDEEVVILNNGAVPVTTMLGGKGAIYEIDALSTAQTITFLNPVKAITIYVMPEAATTPTLNSAVVCIDPPNAAIRDAWLTAGSGSSQRIPIPANNDKGKEEMIFIDSLGKQASISTLGIKRDLGSDALRAFIVAVEA